MELGLQKIKIPVKQEELSIEAITPYLQIILDKFNFNSKKITDNYEKYLGKHDVLDKSRTYTSDSKINNIVCEPHLYAMVDFKCGYTLGNPKEYAQIQTLNTNDIVYLQKYFKDCDLRSVDNDVTKWVYATGVGYYFIQPKIPYPKNNYEAPFKISCLPSNRCVKIYSSYLGEGALFDMIVTTIDKMNINGTLQEITLLSIYMPNAYYEYEYNGYNVIKERFTQTLMRPRPLFKKLPLVEKSSNSDKIGIVEICETLQNAIDRITSNELDNIDEVVNQIYVFENVNLGDTEEEKISSFNSVKRNGVAILNSTNSQFPANLKTLATNLDHKNIMTLKEELTQVMYDCVGVPLASSSITSGGDTGTARSLGNGWENAYTVILKDINNLIKADRELLKIILWICEQSPYSEVNELNASDIEIKYNINRSNNLLTKTQSYVNLVQNEKAPVPPKIAMQICELTSDPEAVGKAVEEYKQQLANEAQAQNATETIVGIQE